MVDVKIKNPLGELFGTLKFEKNTEQIIKNIRKDFKMKWEIKMKCPICEKGKMEKTKEIIKQDGVEFEAFKCNSCGEKLMNMKQLRILANKI